MWAYMRNRSYCILLMTFVTLHAQAHHSRAHFDQDRTIEIEGTVSELSWRSPHIYVAVDALEPDGTRVTWTLEGHSIPGSLRVGWKQDSVKVGDRVLIVAHPNRVADKKFAMLYSATLMDGTTYYAYAIPEGKTVAGLEDRRPTAPSTDFSGTWRHLVPVRVATIESYHAPTDWPLSERGRAQAERFDINDDPVLDCVPMGVPRLILATYSHRWRRFPDRIVIEKERTPQIRTIYLDGRQKPADYVPDELGFSVGRIERDGTLVVETSGFAATPWGNARGLDSSEHKRVIERYRLIEGGYGMSVSYTIEDPVYLAEPVTITGDYAKSSDFEFVAETCDVETARRHLRYLTEKGSDG
jgi:Family of unknown function (DUF6152)